jgi:hypothetical protein
MRPIGLASLSRIRIVVLAGGITVAGAVATGVTVAGAAAGPPAPQLSKTVDLGPVSGQAFVTVSGHARQRLVGTESVPVGTVVDARGGSVRVIGATVAGVGTQSGQYTGGEFQVLQPAAHGHAIRVRLVGGNFAVCGTASAARAPNGQVIRQLSTTAGYGPITSGRNIAAQAKKYARRAAASGAAVAVWRTVDTCKTTVLRVKRGQLTPIAKRPVRMSVGCGGAADAAGADADAVEQRALGGRPARGAKVSSRVLQTLHAGATGTFRTRGRYTAATVCGSADRG